MRVLHILGELKPSGAEMMYAAAAELWQAKGFRCEILSTGQVTGAMTARLQQAGYRIHHIPFRRSPDHVRAVYRFLRRQRFDIVHVNSEQANFWYSAAAYCAGTRRLFRTIHSVFPFRGGLRLRRNLQRRILRSLGVKMIVVSPSVQQNEWEHFGNPSELVPNWFDDRVFVPPTQAERMAARDRLKIAPGSFVVTSVAGTCAPLKNHSAILRAIAMLPQSPEVVYLHVGRENSELGERELAAELGIADRVRFLGLVAPPVPVLQASDIYLMPSFYEGFPCAALEAMGTGLPAILSDAPGLRDFSAVCPEIAWAQLTPESIAGAIRQLAAKSPEERRAIGLRLSAATHRHFGMNNGALAYASLYVRRNGQSGSTACVSLPS